MTVLPRDFANPWDFLVAKLNDCADDDEFVSVVNEMRVAHGLPPVGHGLTYHFREARESVRRFDATWHGAAA